LSSTAAALRNCSTRSLHPTWDIIYALCVDQLESNIRSSSWSTENLLISITIS
jgi:hypothetical protein